jgi:hypothetical protein
METVLEYIILRGSGKNMKKILLVLTIGLMMAPGAYAVPHLQLFIDGATYEWDTQTWVLATTGSVDLYVISANEEHYDVIVSMALSGFGELEDPTSTVSVTGFGYDQTPWAWGFGPITTVETWDGGDDLPRHGIFPTWYAEVNTEDYDLSQMVGDVQPGPDFWDPTINGPGPANAEGQFRVFNLSIDAPLGTSVHFDAYTITVDGLTLDHEIDEFAPFSHDGTTTVVPEPGTILLMSTGLLGLGLSAIRRRKR